MSDQKLKAKSSKNALWVERMVVAHYGVRQRMFVPNVSWGFFPSHEADLVMVTANRYLTEIEIKVSKADIKADLGKTKKIKHRRNPNIHWEGPTKECYFALPFDLDGAEFVPEIYGILRVQENGRVEIERKAKLNPGRRPITDAEYLKLGRLASMRIWSLKNHAYQQMVSIQHHKAIAEYACGRLAAVMGMEREEVVKVVEREFWGVGESKKS